MPDMTRQESANVTLRARIDQRTETLPQLKTGIWVDALIRRAQVAGAFACVVLQGDRDAGSVLVSVRARGALMLYTPERDMLGDRVWRAEALDEDMMLERIASRRDFDPDLMVVEIEDPEARPFIEEPILSDQSDPADAAEPLAAARALFRDR